MKKIIELEHNPCDYTCMWNGIEDLYMRETGEEVPGFMFFTLSGIGNCVYLKYKEGKLPRMALFNDGRPQKMYPKVNELIGFDYRFLSGGSFENMQKKAKMQIAAGRPVILGPLDMYYLPYLKMYRRYHVPCHYVMMAGCDDETQTAYLYDCGREGICPIPYAELEAALAVKSPELGGKNGILIVEFTGKSPGLYEIAQIGFAKKAAEILDANNGITGVKGLRKLAGEILYWESELTEEGCRNSLMNMVEFMGNVPKLPNALMGIPAPDEMAYQACRNSMAKLFLDLHTRYGYEPWREVGEIFKKSGELFAELAAGIVAYLSGNKEGLFGADKLLISIAGLEEAAWEKCR